MPYNYQYRFVGPIWPFVGGLLVGGLFAPNKGPLYPSNGYPVQTYYYYQPVPYYQNNSYYSYPYNQQYSQSYPTNNTNPNYYTSNNNNNPYYQQ